MFQPTTIDDVRDALNALISIRRPEGDNEGPPINDPSVYDLLSPAPRDCVDHAYSTVRSYVLYGDNEINNRAVTTIRNSGYQISVGPDQNDPMRIAGDVTVGEWTLLVEINFTPTAVDNLLVRTGHCPSCLWRPRWRARRGSHCYAPLSTPLAKCSESAEFRH